MQLHLRPPPPLDAFVASIWYWEGTPQAHARELIVAEPGAGLLIDLHAHRFRHYLGPNHGERSEVKGIALCGPRTRAIAIDAFHARLMGAQFRAGGVYPFLRIPVHEICDAHVSLEDIWGREASALFEQLNEAATPHAALHALADSLQRASRRAAARDPAIDLALRRFQRTPQRARVAPVAKELALSPKRFIAAFQDRVGMTPKRYLRMARFRRLLADAWATAPESRVDWAELTYAHGYSDQSHLSREFRELAGVTPAVYLARRGAGPNHVLWE